MLQMKQVKQMQHAHTCLAEREQSLDASASKIKVYQSFPRLMDAAFLYAGQPLLP
jgi:hypothetical protein